MIDYLSESYNSEINDSNSSQRINESVASSINMIDKNDQFDDFVKDKKR